MRGRRATTLLLCATAASCTSSDVSIRQDDVRFTRFRSVARDDAGRFVWVDSNKRGVVHLPHVSIRNVELRSSAGRLLSHSREVTKGQVELRLDEGVWMLPRDRLDVFIDGEKTRSFRIRRVPTEPGEDLYEFWSRVQRADTDWQARGVDAATDWVAAADHPDAELAEGEASRMLRTAAFLLYRANRFDEAAPLLERAGALAVAVGDDDGVVLTTFHQGQLAHGAGALLTATRRYRDAIESAERLGSTVTIAVAVVRNASALAELGRFGEALALLEGLPETPELSRRTRLMSAANIGWIRLQAMKAGLLPMDVESIRPVNVRARQYFEQEKASADAANQRARELALDLVMGDLQTVREGLENLDKIGQVKGEDTAFLELMWGELEVSEGDFDAAERRLEPMLRSPASGTLNLCQARELLARVFEGRGDLDGAINAYQKTLECISDADRQLRSLSSHAQFRYLNRTAAAGLARVLVAKDRPAEAFRLLDRERAAVLEQYVGAIDVDRHQAEWNSYQSARRAEETARYEGCGSAKPGPAHMACESRLRLLKANADAALRTFEAKLPVRQRKLRTAEWLKMLQTSLGDDQALLVVSGYGDNALYLLVDGDGVDATKNAAPLSHWRKRLTGVEHLYVEPDWHPNSYDPFGSETDLSMSLLPHADVLLRPTAEAKGRRIVIADPDGTLPGSAREGAEVARLIDGEVLAHADRDAFLNAWRSSSVIHYAGHARGLHGDPWSVELGLATGTEFTIFDALAEPTNVRLVVLNGCATGPRARAGGGGFPAAMVHLGVQSVVATTHSLRDSATSAFVCDFYEAGAIEKPGRAFRIAVEKSKERADDAWRVMRLWGRR